MDEASVIDDLIRLARDPGVEAEDMVRALGPALETIVREGDPTSLRRLAAAVADAPRPDTAGVVAIACGALVESGFDPTAALATILDRLEDQIAPEALAFAAACRQAAADEPPAKVASDEAENAGGDEEDPVERHGARMMALMPSEGRSFKALHSFSMAVVAMLGRSPESRKASWSRASLRRSLDELGGQYGYAGLMWQMLQVLDDEPLLVLHPARGKGYRARISGLADNFQLHTLLADALVGRFSRRWLRGRRPAAAEVAAARDGAVVGRDAPAVGSFNLWTWRGLRPDGTLPEPMGNSEHWIWNEGVPADVPALAGVRVVLLGPPPYERSWTAGRKFPDMPGSLRVEAVLSPKQVRDELARIAGAVAAEV